MLAPRASEIRSPLRARNEHNACLAAKRDPRSDQERAQLVAVEADGVKLVVEPCRRSEPSIGKHDGSLLQSRVFAAQPWGSGIGASRSGAIARGGKSGHFADRVVSAIQVAVEESLEQAETFDESFRCDPTVTRGVCELVEVQDAIGMVGRAHHHVDEVIGDRYVIAAVIDAYELDVPPTFVRPTVDHRLAQLDLVLDQHERTLANGCGGRRTLEEPLRRDIELVREHVTNTDRRKRIPAPSGH